MSDFHYEYKGYRYHSRWEHDDDCAKLEHICYHPEVFGGQGIAAQHAWHWIDFNPYRVMSLRDFQRYVDFYIAMGRPMVRRDIPGNISPIECGQPSLICGIFGVE